MWIYHLLLGCCGDIETISKGSRRESCFYGCDGYEDLCSTNKKIYLSMDIIHIFFLIFLINLGLSTLYWKCKHPDGMKRKSFKQHGKCIIAELGALTETGNAIRNILTRNGFSLWHTRFHLPFFGSASMASVCRKCCDDVGNLFESLKSMSQTTRKLNVVCAHFSWRAH